MKIIALSRCTATLCVLINSHFATVDALQFTVVTRSSVSLGVGGRNTAFLRHHLRTTGKAPAAAYRGKTRPSRPSPRRLPILRLRASKNPPGPSGLHAPFVSEPTDGGAIDNLAQLDERPAARGCGQPRNLGRKSTFPRSQALRAEGSAAPTKGPEERNAACHARGRQRKPAARETPKHGVEQRGKGRARALSPPFRAPFDAANRIRLVLSAVQAQTRRPRTRRASHTPAQPAAQKVHTPTQRRQGRLARCVRQGRYVRMP